LSLRYAGHHFCFNKVVVSGGSADDEVGRYASLVFPHSFGDAVLQLGRWVAVTVGRGAEHDDCVEGGASGICFRRKSAGGDCPCDQCGQQGDAKQHNADGL